MRKDVFQLTLICCWACTLCPGAAAQTLRTVALTGQHAPGTPAGVLFDYFHVAAATPVLNSAGQVAFKGDLTGDGVDNTNSAGIFSEGSGSLDLVARAGDHAPGLAAGVDFAGFLSPTINQTGQIAFLSGLAGEGVDVTNSLGIWIEESGSLELVVRLGDSVPGMGPDVVFSEIIFPPLFLEGSYPPLLNAAGQIAFSAAISGTGVDDTNNEGLWSDVSGSLATVAREGEQAPGTPGGVVFGSFQETLKTTVLNSMGRTAFLTELVGSGVGSTNDEGIWAEDQFGELHLIARTGDPLEVATADFRTVSHLSFLGGTGNEDGRRSGFNDHGQLAFWARFTDSSEGLFVSGMTPLAIATLPTWQKHRKRPMALMTFGVLEPF